VPEAQRLDPAAASIFLFPRQQKLAAMTVTINGDSREIPDGLSVAGLIEHLGLVGGRVAVERNREVLSRDAWRDTQLAAGDTLEIVHFVGGGDFPGDNRRARN
jgi:thiamine biosynthesis protein ThiS